MFKPGDKIICICNKYEEQLLIKNHMYTFKKYVIINGKKLQILKLLEFPEYSFIDEYFITLKDHRKQKLSKLKHNDI